MPTANTSGVYSGSWSVFLVMHSLLSILLFNGFAEPGVRSALQILELGNYLLNEAL